jgi:hypothetical protein
MRPCDLSPNLKCQVPAYQIPIMSCFTIQDIISLPLNYPYIIDKGIVDGVPKEEQSK